MSSKELIDEAISVAQKLINEVIKNPREQTDTELAIRAAELITWSFNTRVVLGENPRALKKEFNEMRDAFERANERVPVEVDIVEIHKPQ